MPEKIKKESTLTLVTNFQTLDLTINIKIMTPKTQLVHYKNYLLNVRIRQRKHNKWKKFRIGHWQKI